MNSIYRLVETLEETNALLRELSNRLDPSYGRNAHVQTRTYADAVEFHKFATGKPFDHEAAARWSQGEAKAKPRRIERSEAVNPTPPDHLSTEDRELWMGACAILEDNEVKPVALDKAVPLVASLESSNRLES